MSSKVKSFAHGTVWDDRNVVLPVSTTIERVQPRRKWLFFAFASICIWSLLSFQWSFKVFGSGEDKRAQRVPANAQALLDRCRALNTKPSPPPDFSSRHSSDRFVPGTEPVLITNATIWTGESNGTKVIKGDMMLDRGKIMWISEDFSASPEYSQDVQKLRPGSFVHINAQGSWVTPGIVDLHSHLAVESAPGLNGASDGNSLKGPTQPWLRSLDGLNTHDEAYRLAIAGGVTTSLILPGSANAIGGQAFPIKLRPTKERSPTSFLIEPPFGLNGSEIDYSVPPRWRYMKHACGENPSSVYGQTRMDTFWQFRAAYENARIIKEAQDAYCSKALDGDWSSSSNFPESLQWEALVDVLRGKVKVQTHCYEAVDLDDFVRLTNEFKFPVAAFHHAHETYLVPDVLKRAYGDVPPASAMFAAFARYKRESYRHSEFAPKILNDNGLKVVMKSDHPGIVSRYLLHESQQAHYYGLPSNIALRSVTSNPAEVMGLEHRIGYVREGYDADIVVWDSHPLQLGATPVQVFIDGIPQLERQYHAKKAEYLQSVPSTPNFDKEAAETLKYDGLPPLDPSETTEDIFFLNVSSVWSYDQGIQSFSSSLYSAGTVAVRRGEIVCAGQLHDCSSFAGDAKQIDLKGGSINPGLVSFGSNVGLQEIGMEPSTIDGFAFDPLTGGLPTLAMDIVTRAVDGLQFSTRDALLAYRAGVTSAITPPLSEGFASGLSVHFSTGSPHKLSKSAVLQEVAALHFAIHNRGQPSVSTQIATLRRLLTGDASGELREWIDRVVKGHVPLVIDTHSADVIASLLTLKTEIERDTKTSLRLTITGATEAHILAKELGAANVGVILNPVRPFPYSWENRRILPGPPLSQDSAVVHLLKHNVTVGLGVMGVGIAPSISAWSARNTRFDVSWAMIESEGFITRSEAFALASENVEKLLGIRHEVTRKRDLVATEGADLLELNGKVVAIISSSRGEVDIL